jgi:hypothetical protein
MAATAAVLAGCSTIESTRSSVSRSLGTGEVFALYGTEGRWAGPVAPQTENCGPATTGLMSIGSRGFAFDPFQATTVINGQVTEAGALSGTYSRPGPGSGNANANANGARAGQARTSVLSITFTGTAMKDADGTEHIDGSLVSGRCRWTVTLKRA